MVPICQSYPNIIADSKGSFLEKYRFDFWMIFFQLGHFSLLYAPKKHCVFAICCILELKYLICVLFEEFWSKISHLHAMYARHFGAKIANLDGICNILVFTHFPLGSTMSEYCSSILVIFPWLHRFVHVFCRFVRWCLSISLIVISNSWCSSISRWF